MAYSLTYYIEFRDSHQITPAAWRVDFLLKDGPLVIPTKIRHYGPEPAILQRSSSNDDKFTSVIGSKLKVSYMYDGASDTPLPETFINIEEDTWMVNLYKNGQLYWKGFIKPDNATFPWLYPPYEFTVEASDGFSAMKGEPINLDDASSFLYDHISLAELFSRTVFSTVGYEDAELKALVRLKPNVLGGAQNILNDLYIHTDAFYDFTDGPMFSFDCLQRLAESLGARIFYSKGAFWFQRIADLVKTSYDTLSIKATDLTAVPQTVGDINKRLSSGGTDVLYKDRTQTISILPAVKQQKFKYELKAINRVKNFDWRDFDGTAFGDWNSGAWEELQANRVGGGTVEDPYRAQFFGSGNVSIGALFGQTFQVTKNQFLHLQVKAKAYFTTGVRMNVFIVGSEKQFDLDSSGDWRQTVIPGTTDAEIVITPNKTTREGLITVESKRIPDCGPGTYTLFFNIIGQTAANDPDDPLPPGEQTYNEIYPVFLRIFNSPYKEVDTVVTNTRRFSLVNGDSPRFFIDMVDSGLSNTIFYDVAGVKTALPDDSWESLDDGAIPDRTMDEQMARSFIDQAARPMDMFEGEVYSNNLDFHNVLILQDRQDKRCMLLKDNYRIRSCTHSIIAAELRPENSGQSAYEVLPIIQDK